MARQPRQLTVVPNHPHHVILRGNNRRCLFSYPREYRYFLSRLGNASRSHGVPVHTLVQMRNHVHLIATPDDPKNLSTFVKSFAQSYAQYRNKRRSSSGKLFEERYKCKPVLSNEQMAVTTAYIELNPVNAGICSAPEDYPWSTFSIHAATSGADKLVNRVWAPSSWYLSLSDDPETRAHVYRDCFDYYRARAEWKDVEGNPKREPSRKRFERPDRRQAI